MLYANETTPVLYLDNVEFAPILPDQRLRLGFGGNGGWLSEFHEVKNVVMRPVLNDQAGNACVPNLVSFILSSVDDVYIGKLGSIIPDDRQISIASSVWSDGIARTLAMTDISSWTSSNTNVGTVDSVGTLKPSEIGTVVLQNTYGRSYTVTANITFYVTSCATLFAVPSEPYFILGARRQMTLTCNTTLGRVVSLNRCGTPWSSADSSKANITSTGLLQTVGIGNTTVSITYGGLTTTALVRIVEIKPRIHRSITAATTRALHGSREWERKWMD
jgi:hypothetical protein